MSVKNYHTLNGRIRGETLSGSTTNYAPDALGSTFMTTAASGTPRNYYRFKPYGGFVYQGGPDPDPKFLWTGAGGSRLSGAPFAAQYNRARHYGREQGAWTSVDPLWPGEMPYGYVRGNPATRTDPSGKYGCAGLHTSKSCEEMQKDATNSLFGPPTPGNNAMRHCVGSCKAKKVCGTELWFLNLKEIKDTFEDTIAIGIGHKPPHGNDSDIDRHNNEIGWNIGKKGGDCIKGCLEALFGQLLWV